MIREIKESEKKAYNKIVSHIIQSWEWGEFRKKTGVDVARMGNFEKGRLTAAWQVTFHKIPYFPYTIGYLPKGGMPNTTIVNSLLSIGREKKAVFIKLEPDIEVGKNLESRVESVGLVKARKSLFTKYNFLVDLTKTEEKLLEGMHPKTRYNIKVAQKKGVQVYESVEQNDFEIYLKLYFETTQRQKYFGHTPEYHRLAWKTLKEAGMARILIAKYKGGPLVAWMLLNFGDTLYYPYGGSSNEYREVMASNLVAWEAIKLGQKLKLKTLDLWGALGLDADSNDPWHGFHRFKAGYGPRHVEYIGSWDLVLKPSLYRLFNFADRARWAVLKARGR